MSISNHALHNITSSLYKNDYNFEYIGTELSIGCFWHIYAKIIYFCLVIYYIQQKCSYTYSILFIIVFCMINIFFFFMNACMYMTDQLYVYLKHHKDNKLSSKINSHIPSLAYQTSLCCACLPISIRMNKDDIT